MELLYLGDNDRVGFRAYRRGSIRDLSACLATTQGEEAKRGDRKSESTSTVRSHREISKTDPAAEYSQANQNVDAVANRLLALPIHRSHLWHSVYHVFDDDGHLSGAIQYP